MTFERLRPACSASGKKLASFGNAARKDAAHRAACPVCGKPVMLRKTGLDRWPGTIPHHRAFQMPSPRIAALERRIRS